MTLPASSARVAYPGTGTTGPFAYPFRIFAAADLKVTKRQVTGTEVLLNYPLDFAVSGASVGATGINDTAGGNVTPTVAIATGETLVIRRATVLGQPIDIRNQGSYFPGTIEDDFDRLAMQIVSHQDQLDRSFGLSESYDPSGFNLRMAPGLAGQVLGWASGNALTSMNVSAGATVLPGASRTVSSLSSYLANNASFNVRDYGAVGDGNSHPLSNYFATLAAAQLVYPAATSLANEIDWAASVAAVSAAGASGGFVFSPHGTYLQSATVSPSSADIVLIGEGSASVWKATAASFNVVTLAQTATRFKALSMRFRGAAVDNTTTQFAIFTNPLAAPDDVEIAFVFFGESSTAGASLNNGVKIDGGNGWNIHDCKVRYLWGTISGTGYGILAGTTNRLHAYENEFIGTTNRGRHAVYLSGGCTYCDVHDNHAEGLAEDAFPIFSQSFQAANLENHVHHNTALNCGQLTAGSAAFSINGNSSRNVVEENRAINFQGHGYLVAALGTGGQTDGNVFSNNKSYFAQWNGIMNQGAQNTDISFNKLFESGRGVNNGFGAIAVAPSGAVPSSGVTVRGNKGTGAFLRSGLDLTGAVLATGLKVDDNYFPDGQTAKIDNPNTVLFYGRNNDFGLSELSGDRGDTSPTVKVGMDAATQMFETALTANRVVTLDTPSGFGGASFRIVRTGLGAFTLTVQNTAATVLKVLPSATAAAALFVFDQAAVGGGWRLVEYAPL